MPYFLNQSMHTQVPCQQLFKEFLGPTESVIEETIID
jgi:hypothetical protein